MNGPSIVLVFMGYYFTLCCSEGHQGKHVHIKVLLPIYKHNHRHVHTVYKHVPPPPLPNIIIHKHHHHHGHKQHGHDHKHKVGHEHQHGHHHKDLDGNEHENWDIQDEYEHKKHHDWSSYADSGLNEDPGLSPPPEVDPYTFNEIESNPENYEGDYANSQKSVKLEKFQLHEAKNSGEIDPVRQHVVTGSYRVQQSSPDGVGSTSKEQKLFQVPLADIHLQQTSYGGDASRSNFEEEEGLNDEWGKDYENFDYGAEEKKSTLLAGNYEFEPLKQFFYKA
ncbi:uncharacterized protein [Euwallacea similis]|uniref:uncharacterized protein n=1 Tax=Euwallacea similis TaxID=1736056 RepID=UPI00344ECDE0